jgi:DNA-binding LytR/AlgR family response regulator
MLNKQLDQEKKYNCIIIDDEAYSIEDLKCYIENVPYLTLIKTYEDPIAAVREIAITKEHIDFLLLDIDMPKLSGLDVARVIRHKVDKLIFVTAHAKYSLEAYDVFCNQYLLKPFSQQMFVKTINKLIEAAKEEKPDQVKEFIYLKSVDSGNYFKLVCSEIISINALEHYVIIHTVSSKYIQHISMKEIEKKLNRSDNFIRIHKSHIISIIHIVSVSGNTIMLTNNHEATIGSTYKQAFNEYLRNNSLG